MLLDFDILKKFGTDDEAIRKLFTAPEGSPLYEKRKTWEDRLESRIDEGTAHNMRNYQFFAAADLAWDSNMITKELVPLQLYAQGKITFKSCAQQIADLSPELRDKFIERDEKGNPTGIDIPAFHKVVVSLTRSFITRRAGALALRYTKQTPFFQFEPLSTSFVAKLRGDVLSQRIEMITNAYGYRHDLIQIIRKVLMYSYQLEFAATAWDKERQYRKEKRAPGLNTSQDAGFSVEPYVAREGLLNDLPHPTRTFWDQAFSPSTFNTDTGCTYGADWDVCRYGDIDKNPKYWNRKEIEYVSDTAHALQQNRAYWELYYANAPIRFPNIDMGSDVPGQNDRKKNLGVYSAEEADASVLRVEMREKVIPAEVGLGTYPYPVWVRLVVAGGRTVIYGEILPSIPCTYWGFNCDDGKLLNNAWLHDILPWQDLLSNGLTNLLLSQRAALIKIIALDLDLVSDPETVKKIRKIISGDAIYQAPVGIEFKGSTLENMGMKPREAVQMIETQTLQNITTHYQALMQLLAMAERVLGFSSAESAQSEPREVSATESANIAQTVNTTLAFMGVGIDEGIDAKKRQLYESFVAKAESRVQAPVVNRYTSKTIEKAGFKVLDESEDGTSTSMYQGDARKVTLVGTKEMLVYDYNFSSRDGSERPSNAKAAEVLVTLLAQLVQFPGFLQKLGTERLYEFLNQVVMLSGAGVDLRFDLRDGETTEIPTGDPVADSKQAVESAIEKIITAIEQDRAKIARIEQLLAQMIGAPAASPQPPVTTQ